MSNKIKYHKLSEKFHAQNKTPVNTIPISSFILTYHLQPATVISENISISKGKKNPPLFFQILKRNIFYRMSGEETDNTKRKEKKFPTFYGAKETQYQEHTCVHLQHTYLHPYENVFI